MSSGFNLSAMRKYQYQDFSRVLSIQRDTVEIRPV